MKKGSTIMHINQIGIIRLKEKEGTAMEFQNMKKENNQTAAREMNRFFGFLVLPKTACCLCCCYDTGGNFFCK